MNLDILPFDIMPFDVIMIPAQILLSIVAAYVFVLGMAGLVQFRVTKSHKPKNTFAIIVPAHNEEMVIGPIVDNLLHLDYPRELFDVFIISDNSTDATADIARSCGAQVYERFNTTERGKGYALEWFFNKLFKMPKNYDAVVIFDADNLVDTQFLQHMNNRFCDGSKIVQGYIDAKNPLDTWVTASFAMSFWVANRMAQLSRYNFGLSNTLGGTGMAISVDLLKEIGWGATSLTEDLEFSLKALLLGHKTTYAYEAVVYDEKPLTFMQAWRQRKRWALGHVELFRTYSAKFIKQAIKRRDPVLLDAALITIQPILVVLIGISGIIGVVDALIIDIYTPIFNIIWPPLLWELVFSLQLMYPFLVIWLDKLPKKVIKWSILHYPLFLYSWTIIVFLSFFGKTRVLWSHTVHTRSISYAEVLKNR